MAGGPAADDVSVSWSTDAELDKGPPFAVVRVLPAKHPPYWLPALFVENKAGEVEVSRKAMTWAHLSLGGYPRSVVDEDIKTVDRFVDFERIFISEIACGHVLERDDLDYLVYAYLTYRYNGTLDNEARCCLGGLNWRSLAMAPLRREFKALARYIRFCATTDGLVDLGVGSYEYKAGTASPMVRRLNSLHEQNDHDFLVHLRAAREYWANKYGE